MIQRERDANDKRKVMVSPTAAAEGALAEAPSLFQEHFTEAFARLADWERSQILSSLQRIVALMEAGDVEAGPILSTGPLDATPEKTEAYLDPGQAEDDG
jgi:hypothetical protein